jgi:hypothetical protein
MGYVPRRTTRHVTAAVLWNAVAPSFDRLPDTGQCGPSGATTTRTPPSLGEASAEGAPADVSAVDEEER